MSPSNTDDIKKAIQAILFISGQPLSVTDIAKALDVPAEKVAESMSLVKKDFDETGLVITESNAKYQLVSSPDVAGYLEKYLQSQLREKLSDAALETLAIIAYRQPCPRSLVESVRGVNCQYALRLLMQRGLVEKTTSPSDARVPVYITTHEFLHHLGLQSIKEMPDFDHIVSKMEPPEHLQNL